MSTKPKRELTEEEKKARSERARENGRKGGRPPKTAWSAEARLRDQARARGESMLTACVEYWIELLQGKHEEATHDHRLRASQCLADRCGLPIRTETGLDLSSFAVKLVEARGWRDRDGVLHEVEAVSEPGVSEGPGEPN